MSYIAAILIALIILVGGALGISNYATLGNITFVGSLLSFNRPIGSTLTSITSATKISDLATILPANFNTLNADKIEVSTTTLPFLTTLLNLTSVDTIGTGVWQGTAIGVGYGGTGTTTPTLNQVILGNGASGFKLVGGFGTSGQFLTSNGAGNVPTWQTSSVNLNDNYNWTGIHTFTNSVNTIASSTQYNINAGTINASSSLIVGGYSVHGTDRVCRGVGTLTSAGLDPGNYSDTITCGFQPTILQFNFFNGGSGTATTTIFGSSDGINNYMAGVTWNGATSSSKFLFVTHISATVYIYGTATFTTTGFNLNYYNSYSSGALPLNKYYYFAY